jgi:prophage regulatory protein
MDDEMNDDIAPYAPPERLLRIGTVLDRTGFSRATLYRKIADGSFPKQVKISERCAAWRESEVNAWITSIYAGGMLGE